MTFVDGFVAAVPDSHRAAYEGETRKLADLFIECGAVEVVDAWGADVPEGKLTSFPMAVQRKPGETVVFGWVVWPSRAVRDAGWEKAMADPRIAAMPGDLYDGKRMIFGGFDVIQTRRKGD
ncbi:MAG: DUF1428 domain-containing protein [Paracoccaceae bacterium]|nr:MAG: DUF1428 domain-containing protein [Paracoccaceae bacterium]